LERESLRAVSAHLLPIRFTYRLAEIAQGGLTYLPTDLNMLCADPSSSDPNASVGQGNDALTEDGAADDSRRGGR
jgi:hypothetical protein